MRSLLVLVVVFSLAAPAAVRAAQAPDPLLVQGLQTCVANGIESGVRVWYPDRPEIGAEMSATLSATVARLGSSIDYEIVATQPISKRVTRYYVALYFARSPVWIRIDRYQNADKSFFFPLKCSTNPDDILPGYVTEFYR